MDTRPAHHQTHPLQLRPMLEIHMLPLIRRRVHQLSRPRAHPPQCQLTRLQMHQPMYRQMHLPIHPRQLLQQHQRMHRRMRPPMHRPMRRQMHRRIPRPMPLLPRPMHPPPHHRTRSALGSCSCGTMCLEWYRHSSSPQCSLPPLCSAVPQAFSQHSKLLLLRQALVTGSGLR